MMLRLFYIFLAGLIPAAADGAAQAPENIALTVPAGAPLRVYLTKKLPKKLDEPVEAKLIEPLFAFDREVAPAGSGVFGTVIRLDPVSKMQRATAIFGGDFTPLHRAEVQFTRLVLPDGRELAVQTIETQGLTSIYVPPRPRKNPKNAASPAPNGGVLGTAKQAARDQINARTQGVIDIVRGPDKKERVAEYFLMKLPYHPQWVRKGTRFDPELGSPLEFGAAPIQPAALRMLATQPPPDSAVHARLITPLDSGVSKQGERVEALLTQPLFSADHQLILPEGTRVSGVVTLAHRAQWFHRGGRLRFNFQSVDLPESLKIPEILAEAPAELKVQAQLDGAESGTKAQIKVDQEGTAKATESKTRFVAPVLALLAASRAADNDAGRHSATGTGTGEANISGRTLGGGLGFGLFGAIAAQKSKTFGTVMGYYGLAWSVYSNIIARGFEVEFGKNAAVDLKFSGHAPPPGAMKAIADGTP